jgi:hypothetical protein
MATPGTIISGLGHIGLIGWLIIGLGFDAEPLQLEAMDVSVISGEEFDQMRARTTPDPGDADPQAPVPPDLDATPPDIPAAQAPSQPAPPPTPLEPPASELPPPPPPSPVAPQTDVADALPVAPEPPAAPLPTPDVDVSQAPTPPQAPTVASTITQPPPPDAQTDDIVRDQVVPDDSAEADVVADEQEATAPEETTTQIVIADLAPTTSVRPTTRPSRPTPVVQPRPAQTETAPSEPVTATAQDDVLAALAGVAQQNDAPAVAAGPPMTGAERDSFRVSVNRCWNVDPGSVAARVTVEVAFNLDRDGSVRGNDVRLVSSQGDSGAVDIAFQAARRAVLRCQSGGYQLPADKYDQWQEVVITFDPSGMRLR